MTTRPVRNPVLRGGRELADIVIVLGFNIGIAAALFTLAGERAVQFEPAISVLIPLLTLVFIWGVLAVRRQRWSEVGLRRGVN